MSADHRHLERPPRVGVALRADHPGQGIVRELRGRSLDVHWLPSGRVSEGEGEAQGFDLLLVDRARDEGVREWCFPSSAGRWPGVVLLGRGESPVELTCLYARGVRRILDADRSPAELARAIDLLAQSELAARRRAPAPPLEPAAARLADFLSRSPSMRRFLDVVARVVDADTTLLVTGETGVGKERLVRAIHAESRRAPGAFVAVHCAALPENLIEGELFGHERGAFTGAHAQRKGHFELADGGTLLLDEIGEMPLHLQVKLLRVLENRELMRVGGTRPVRIDVRVIAATHRDVADQVRQGKFREDLYYRVNVVRLEVPPLRERLEDVPELVGLLIRHFRGSMLASRVDGIEEPAMEAILEHRWPGNVRELIHAVEHAMLLSQGREIRLDDLPEGVRAGPPWPAAAPREEAASPEVAPPLESMTLHEVRTRAIESAERDYLRALLLHTRGGIQPAAKRAGISTRALYERMRRYGLERDSFRR